MTMNLLFVFFLGFPKELSEIYIFFCVQVLKTALEILWYGNASTKNTTKCYCIVAFR